MSEAMLEAKSSSSSSEDEDDVLDLSRQELSKLRRATAEAEINTTSLILDHNHLTRLDNVHTYLCLEKLSAAFNGLVRMFQVGKLGHLKILDLSHNNISVMEGLKELRLLVWLNLSSNAITNIENIAHCVHLEHLDLSDNRIAAVADLSFLKNLNTLLLHRNLLTCLRDCEHFLPRSLTTLTLNENKISCLTEVQHLQQLNVLEHLVIAGNPAVQQPEETSKQFDYRPYIINWCLNITSLDGIPVAAKESLKAEWMYSQSQGRQFGSGEHEQLLQYLVETCPLHPGEDWQEDEKLNLILSKVQEHQSSLHSDPVSVQQGEKLKKLLPSPRNLALSPRSRHSSQHKRTKSVDLMSNSSSPQKSRSGNITPVLSRATPSRRSVSQFNGHRTSPSPQRKRTSDKVLTGYRVALPKTLYNSNHPQNLMTQSMSFEPRFSDDKSGIEGFSAGEAQNVMTASFDPSLIPTGHHSWRNPGSASWTNDFIAKELFQPTTDTPVKKETKLMDISTALEDDQNQSKLGSGSAMKSLQQHPNLVLSSSPRLNPVPESLNSPDTPLGAPMVKNKANYAQNQERDARKHEEKVVDEPTKRETKPLSRVEGVLQEHRGSNVPTQSTTHHSSITETNGQQIKTLKKKTSSVPTREATSSMGNLPRPKPQGKANSVKQQMTNRHLSVSKTGPIAARLLSDGSSSHSESEFDLGSRHSTPQRVDGHRGPQNQTVHQQRIESSMARSMTAPTKKCYAPERYSLSAMTRSTHQSRSTKPNRPSSASISRPSASSNERSDASSKIQSALRGSNDVRVRELKQEVRALRTEEHVRHLSKELQSTKEALNQERKLRMLQMDAIKVLCRELQMMDAIQRGGNSKSRPSGTDGSKISSRSSEHSIAKLMDSLEATAPPSSTVENANRTNSEVDNEGIRQLGFTCDRLQAQIETLQATLDGVVNIVHEELKNHAYIREREQRRLWRTEVAVQTQSEMSEENTGEREGDLKSMQTMESITSFPEKKNESSLPIASLQSKELLDVADSDTIIDSPLMNTTDKNLITEFPKMSTQDTEVQDSLFPKKSLEPKKDAIPPSLEKSATMEDVTRPSTLPLLVTKPASLSVGEDVNSFASSLVERLIEKGLQESVAGNDGSNREDSLKD